MRGKGLRREKREKRREAQFSLILAPEIGEKGERKRTASHFHSYSGVTKEKKKGGKVVYLSLPWDVGQGGNEIDRTIGSLRGRKCPPNA